MSDLNIHEELIKRISSGFIDEQTSNKEEDKSFVYLEKNLLNLLLAYLLVEKPRKTDEEREGAFELKILAELEQIMEHNKKAFEELINLLKEQQ